MGLRLRPKMNSSLAAEKQYYINKKCIVKFNQTKIERRCRTIDDAEIWLEKGVRSQLVKSAYVITVTKQKLYNIQIF